MIGFTPKDKDLLLGLANAAGGLGTLLGATYFLGELHGLACTAIALILYTSLLSRRVVALERELRSSHNGS
jgi:hypothetical protein